MDLGASLHTLDFWARLAEIGFLNLLLSGDNAVVIALATRGLPKRQRFLGQVWGTAGAVVLRLVFVGIVSALLRVPLLRLAGGGLLIWIAIKLVQPVEDLAGTLRPGASFWDAVRIILLADVMMSLDNVLAIAAAAKGDILLVGLGIATSLPFVVWGSGVLANLMNRHAWIIWLGGGVLGYVAADMILGDPVVSTHLGSLAHAADRALPLGLAAAMTALGWWLARSSRRRGKDVRPADAMVHPAVKPSAPRDR
ncbi:MAG TPA: TerC family protein [Candidatus Methylomirabilis sp.]|nr:TerC family protein [Candidatus Methylomirabilis sp.]